MKTEITVSTAAYDGYSFEEAFASLKRLGIRRVEVAFIGGYTEAFTEDYFNDANAEIINKLLVKNNLSCPAFSSHVDLTSDGIVDIFKKRMTFAAKLGTEVIVTNAAPTEKADLFYQNIKELATFAEDLQIKIGLENPGDGVANLLDTGAMASEVIKKIGSTYVGVNYDFGNLLSHCFGKILPETDYLECKQETIHYHIKDVQPDDEGWYFTKIGEGAIDYSSILQDICGQSTPVPLSLEIPLRLRRNINAKPLRNENIINLDIIEDTLEKSVNFIDQCLTEKV